MGKNIDELIFCELLPEMFKRVGLKNSDINDLTKVPQWFTTQKWTIEQEQDFTNWVARRLRSKLNMPVKQAEREAKMFLLNFGWSLEDRDKQLELDLGEQIEIYK